MGLSPVLMSKLAIRKPLGLYVGDREVTVCRAALTPLGAVELTSSGEAYDNPEQLPQVVERLLRPYLGKSKSPRVRVSLGLPATNVYFATRLAQPTDRESTSAVMLNEFIRSSDINIAEMQIEVVRGQPKNHPLLSLVACRRKYLSNLLDAMKTCGVRPFRAEPAPFALLRLGATRLRAPRKAAAVIRFFLGPAEGVAVLLQGDMPLAWRTFDLPAGSESGALLSTAMALQVVSRHCGEAGRPDAVLIHGRLDLAETFRNDMFRTVMGCLPQHTAGPSYDARSIALGLAMGCREAEQALDLSRTLKSRLPVWQVLPYGQIAAQFAVLAGLTAMVEGHARDVRQSSRMVHDECSAHLWTLEGNDTNLKKEKTELEDKLKAVRGYVGSRILWSTYTRDVASRLTENMVLRSFAGNNDLATDGKPSKRSLVLSLTAPIALGKTLPHEIDQYLEALRNDEILRRDFPRVELAGLRGSEGKVGSSSQASFTVNCLPKLELPAAKGAAKAKAK